ncbi:MAG: radical SAM protein, partial [Myxococcales bacterium]|nr:radical SAM protein [Myxococcales bacterium]
MALLDLILGYDCNLACDYCTITPAMRARALSSQAVVSALRNGRGDGFDACSFTGGEPTIRADLLGLVRAAKKLGYVRVKVQSNGLLYAQRPNLERLVAVGADDFHLSIHTHDAAAYDALVRREGAFASMCAGLQNLIALGLDPTVALIVKSDTYARLPAAIDWLADEGVTRADLWYVSLTDQ